MKEVPPSYRFYPEYSKLRDMVMAHKPPEADIAVGKTNHYDLPDFRLEWNGIRIIDIIPQPKSVALFLEFDKILNNREFHDRDDVSRFEDAAGALVKNKNRVLKFRLDLDIDDGYLKVFIEYGLKLYLAELKRRHKSKQ